MSKIYTIYGSGGYAREVMPLLRSQINSINHNNKFYFIDDFVENNYTVNGSECYSFNSLIEKFGKKKIYCCIAISNKKVREKLTQKCLDYEINLISIISENSVIMDNVIIGEGSVLSPFVTITSNVKIGKSFHANIYSYVAHDCIIEDYVTFAPGVKCNGNVYVKSGAYIGTGAIIHPGKKNNPIIIGQNSVVGAGAVVTKSIPDNVTVIGNPAQILTRELLKKIKR